MATQIICDKCKKSAYGGRRFNGQLGIDGTTYLGKEDRSFDLCNDCLFDLRSWLYG